MTKLERVGRRIYLVDLPFAHKDEAKRTLGLTGSNWDAGRRQWFVGLAKKEMAEGLVVRLNMGATQATRSSAKAAEALGLSADTPAAVVADAMSDAGQDAAAARMRASETDEQIDGMAVYAKVRYRGRLWFVVAETKDVTRCRIVGMDRKGRTLQLSIRAKDEDELQSALEEYQSASGGTTKLGALLKEQLKK